MSIPFNESAIPARHSIEYQVLDSHRGTPTRQIEVLAGEDEIQNLLRDGFLVRERIIEGEHLQRLRDALDEVMATDERIETGRETFSGSYARFLHDKHPAFLELHDFAPALSVARAVLGPVLWLRVFTGRLTKPGDEFSEVEWHLHQRMIPRPLPPVWCRPQTLDCLLYLDEIDEENGPLAVLPGSHEWLDANLPAFDCQPKEGEVVLNVPAGSLVMAFGSLWHRALPTNGRRTRRLLLFAYAPAYLKGSSVGIQPENGLSKQLLSDPNVSLETRELLGAAGWM